MKSEAARDDTAAAVAESSNDAAWGTCHPRKAARCVLDALLAAGCQEVPATAYHLAVENPPAATNSLRTVLERMA